MSDESDLLAVSDDNPQGEQAPVEDAAPDFDAGPPPSDKAYPDWVPSEFHAPEKRQELLDAIGVKAERPTGRPEGLPDKFWKDDAGVNVEGLAKSYSELEKKLHQGKTQAPEKYEVKAPEGMELGEGETLLSEADETLFRDLGLNNDQAQQLTEHFWSNVVPMLAEQQGELELTKLANAWDIKLGDTGVKESTELSNRLAQLKQWGNANLPDDVMAHLKRSSSGVQALWAMMQAKAGMPRGDAPQQQKDKTEIDAMINDDQYWDPGPKGDAYRKQVEQHVNRRGG